MPNYYNDVTIGKQVIVEKNSARQIQFDGKFGPRDEATILREEIRLLQNGLAKVEEEKEHVLLLYKIEEAKTRRLKLAAEAMEIMLAAADENEIGKTALRVLSHSFPEGTCWFSSSENSRTNCLPHMYILPDSSESPMPTLACTKALPDCWAVKLGRTFKAFLPGELPCRELSLTEGLAGHVCVPLMAEGATQGVFGVSVKQPQALQDEDVNFVGLLANYTAVAVSAIRSFQVCPLTGLLTRGFVEKMLRQELARAQRYAKPLVLAMLDLDNFKDVNDRFGHQEGDRVLEAFGETAKHTLRQCDVAIRYGGEEFLFIFPEIDRTQAFIAVERFRTLFQRATSSGRFSFLPKGVTVSCGLAEFPSEVTSWDELVAVADRNLYWAKENGRNRTVCCNDLELPEFDGRKEGTG